LEKKIISTDKAPKPLAAYSQAVKVGSMLYVSGQVAIDPKTGELVNGGIREQTEQVIKNIVAIVEAAGGTLENIIKINVYLADKKYYSGFNEVYRRYFNVNPPARTTVEAKPPKEEILIEMDAIAYVE